MKEEVKLFCHNSIVVSDACNILSMFSILFRGDQLVGKIILYDKILYTYFVCKQYLSKKSLIIKTHKESSTKFPPS